MRKIHLPIIVVLAALGLLLGASVHAQDAVTLTVLIHQNPPLVDFMNEFNAKFQEAHPNITVDMAVVNNSDLSTTTQTRLALDLSPCQLPKAPSEAQNLGILYNFVCHQ